MNNSNSREFNTLIWQVRVGQSGPWLQPYPFQPPARSETSQPKARWQTLTDYSRTIMRFKKGEVSAVEFFSGKVARRIKSDDNLNRPGCILVPVPSSKAHDAQRPLFVVSTGCTRRVLPCGRLFFADNSHGYTGHPAYDFCLRRVVKSANILVGMRVGNYDQLAPVHLTPTANVTVSQFHEVDGTVELRIPSLGADLSLICVNLHKRTGTDEWKERVVFQPDIAVYGFTQIQMLQETHGYLIPLFHDSGKQICFLQSKFRLKLRWQ